MVEQVILLLIYIAVVVGLVWLVIWVLEYLGLAIPPMIQRVLWVIAVLVVLLLLWRAFGSAIRI